MLDGILPMNQMSQFTKFPYWASTGLLFIDYILDLLCPVSCQR